MLPKNKRISKDSFKSILLKGTLYHSENCTLRILPSEKEGFAVLISKKVAKSAVDRNRMRRRVYSVVRDLLPNIKTTSKNLISLKTGAKKLSFDLQKEEITKLFKKARLI
ncbi:MAG: ribonuclease P protein component [Candidatus Paceibacterota bacterium]